MTRQGLLWALVALLGIVVAAVIAWSASQLAGQRIGLASAPLSVASRLAPPPPLPPRPRRQGPGGGGPAPPAVSTPLIATLPQQPAPAPSPPASAAQPRPQTGNSPAPTQREDSGHRSAGGSSDGQRDD